MTGKSKGARTSANVFADLGFEAGEAENLLLRAELMSRICDMAGGVSQREAAKSFGVSQPRLNDLVRGKIDKFSLDALVNMLAHAGMRVELSPKKAVDPDNPPWRDEMLGPPVVRQGQTAKKAPTKVLTTLHIDDDVLRYFRSTGTGFQARINDALRLAKERGEVRGAVARVVDEPKIPEAREAKAKYQATGRRRPRQRRKA